MTETEFNEVLQEIQRQLQLFGISEIGFADYYNSEGERVTDPRDLAVQILRSFDLHLATLDHDTYRKSLTNTGRLSIGPG